MISDLVHGFLDILYPPCCLGCSARPESPALPLCPSCLRRMDAAPPMNVAARIDRLPTAWGTVLGAHAMWVFDKGGALQSVQHALKYGDRPSYGVSLGKLLGTSYQRAGWPNPNGVVPVPLHRLRLLERGYNQAEMLGLGVADPLGTKVMPDLLSRPRATRSQTNLSREARWANVSTAFEATRELDSGTYLVVDDVLTTGSTAMACAQALRANGADEVTIATLCLART